VHPDETPISEQNPLRPLSPYAVSKVAQDFLGYQYFKSYGLRTIRTRGFNHEGPRRGEVFVMSNFARQIAAIEAGRQEPVIRVGNLDSVRDFTDVRDMVRAYALLLERGDPDAVYLACSGRSLPVRDLIEGLAPLARIPVTFTSHGGLRRAGEQPDLLDAPVGDRGDQPRLFGDERAGPAHLPDQRPARDRVRPDGREVDGGHGGGQALERRGDQHQAQHDGAADQHAAALGRLGIAWDVQCSTRYRGGGGRRRRPRGSSGRSGTGSARSGSRARRSGATSGRRAAR